MSLRVVKVGGSLLSRADLAAALQKWLEPFSDDLLILVAGGGAGVDWIRQLDQRFELGAELGHQISIELMGQTARVLQHVLAPLAEPLVVRWHDLQFRIARPDPGVVVLDCREFLLAVEPQVPGATLPRSWNSSSDSIAARLARACHAEELILLKSRQPEPNDWEQLVLQQVIDPAFPESAQGLAVRVMKLPDQQGE